MQGSALGGGGTGHLGLTETQRGRLWTACGQRRVDSKGSQTTPAATSTSSIRQLLGANGTSRQHPAQPRHTNRWAPRTRKRHQQEHRPQRPTERSDPTQHAKGRPGDCPGPRKGTTTRQNVTREGGQGASACLFGPLGRSWALTAPAAISLPAAWGVPAGLYWGGPGRWLAGVGEGYSQPQQPTGPRHCSLWPIVYHPFNAGVSGCWFAKPLPPPFCTPTLRPVTLCRGPCWAFCTLLLPAGRLPWFPCLLVPVRTAGMGTVGPLPGPVVQSCRCFVPVPGVVHAACSVSWKGAWWQLICH